MNTVAQAITNRLSLRKPQYESLEILQKITDIIGLEPNAEISRSLDEIKKLYPTCTDFERDFTSICFHLATGVGKTRLMGAFISYLYIAKGIKNFFVLAPNLTIYSKLIDDLSNTQNPKYVFKGISEFSVIPPRIITGDNYDQYQQLGLEESVRINIFNISKINSEVRGGKEPRIKRLSEYLGESYFNYLAELPDLVLLMDESHHYRANAGMKALSELKPILGLELTATPIDASGNKFKNVVFDYPLALALRDEFVKEPAVATRRDFDPEQYKDEPHELDKIKLEDGIRIHEDTKIALDIYARNTGKRRVKPFVLVVAKDTDHAKEIRDIIESDSFFDGEYKGCVMDIHSNQRGEEKDENIEKLLLLESPNNTTEIVIHVNMLKEGWDVTNLYTIIPLRTANSHILTEQTIGRGLRLPYGLRTGVEKVDKLTIIAHDNFQRIVESANDPNSIIRKENIIEIDPSTLPKKQEVITSNSVYEAHIATKKAEANKIEDVTQKNELVRTLELQEEVIKVIQKLHTPVSTIQDLHSESSKANVTDQIISKLEQDSSQAIKREDIKKAINEVYEKVVTEVVNTTIPIPQITIKQSSPVVCGFTDFDLDVSSFNYQPVSEEIVRRTLRTNQNELLASDKSVQEHISPLLILVEELKKINEVDYERDEHIIQKLVRQATEKIEAGKNDEDINNIVLYHKKEIAEFIYAQLKQHFYLESTGYENVNVYPFSKLEPHNYSKLTEDTIHAFTDTIIPISTIPSKVFNGFKKACHTLYKFDSKSEKDLSIILESDTEVLKWLRPSLAQFSLYWNNNTQRYEPDFIVETREVIYMIEVKKESDLDGKEVQQKSKTAKKYCETATKYNLNKGGKRWEYVIIPHNYISIGKSFNGLIN